MTTQVLTVGDGTTVTYDPDGLWKTWNIDEIYTGVPALNKYVPKVNDHLLNVTTNQRYRVTSVNLETLVAVYEDVGNGNLDAGDILSAGVGAQPDTYRVYLDTSVTPYILAVDARLKIGGSSSSYAKIFKGTDLSSNGKVLSMLYDQAGTFLTQNIPLEVIAIDSHDNIATKAVPPCNTNEVLVDNDLVTVVIYDTDGHVITRRTCWVNNTSFIRSQSVDTRYISHISLESPFMSQTDSSVLEYPINVPLQSLNLMGRVWLSDGSYNELPVDDTKFSLLGLERFVGTYTGQKIPLVLRYSLAADEVAYGIGSNGSAVSNDGKFVSAPYSLLTTAQRGAFSLKLAAFPVWRSDISAYQLKWFLTSLDRDIVFDVTPYVYFNQSSDVFNGTSFGVVQRLSARVNLFDVSQALPNFIHTQTQSIVLTNAGSANGANWKIAFEQNQTPLFAESLFAQYTMINQDLWRVSVRSSIANYSDWLNRIYYDSKPLFDPVKEQMAPAPTHMVITNGAVRSEVPIESWADQFSISNNLANEANLQIEFIRRVVGSVDLRLGVVCLPLHPAL